MVSSHEPGQPLSKTCLLPPHQPVGLSAPCLYQFEMPIQKRCGALADPNGRGLGCRDKSIERPPRFALRIKVDHERAVDLPRHKLTHVDADYHATLRTLAISDQIRQLLDGHCRVRCAPWRILDRFKPECRNYASGA